MSSILYDLLVLSAYCTSRWYHIEHDSSVVVYNIADGWLYARRVWGIRIHGGCSQMPRRPCRSEGCTTGMGLGILAEWLGISKRQWSLGCVYSRDLISIFLLILLLIECPLSSLTSLLENPRIRDTDSLVICIQIHCPVGPSIPQQPSVCYVPKDLLDGLEASLDNPSQLLMKLLTKHDRSNFCFRYGRRPFYMPGKISHSGFQFKSPHPFFHVL
jgi:hypothetical protein